MNAPGPTESTAMQDIRAGDLIGPPRAKRRRRWWPRVLLAVASLVVALLLAEGVGRVFDLAPPVYAARRIEPGGIPFASGPRGLLVFQPNSTFDYVYDPAGDARGYYGDDGRLRCAINALGYRGAAVSVEKPEGVLRVVCLGDSFTFGEGVRAEDAYPAVMQRVLSARLGDRPVEVINAGVHGYGVDQAIGSYIVQYHRFQPDIVTFGFFLNDVSDPGETIRQYEARLRDADLSWLGEVSTLWSMLERRRHADALQAEYFATTRASFESQVWDRAKDLLAGMEQLSETPPRFRFVVVIFPMLWQLDGEYPFRDLHEKIAAACREAGCEVVDVLPVYRGHAAESLWAHPTDHHPNDVAHRMAAERIVEYLMGSEAGR